MVSEIQDNSRYRLFRELIDESKAVVIASVSLIVSMLLLLIAWSALNSATIAKAKVDYELEATRAEVTAMKNTMDLQNVYLQSLYFLMQTEGLDPPPLPEE